MQTIDHFFTRESQLTEEYRLELCQFKENYCHQYLLPVCLSSGTINIAILDCQPLSACIGTILIIQGRAETMDKYLSLIKDFVAQNYRVITYDHPYQGYSSDLQDLQMSWIGCFDDYLKALSEVLSRYDHLNPQIISVSMGGMIAIQALNRALIKPRKLILVTPMMRNSKNGFPPFIAKFIAKSADLFYRFLGNKYAPAPGQMKEYRIPEFQGNGKTHSINRLSFYHRWYQNHRQHPLGGVTWHWLYECYNNEPEVILNSDTEILFLEAEEDTIVDNSCNKTLIKKSDSAINFITIKNAYHDLLNETDGIRDQVLTFICHFLEKE